MADEETKQLLRDILAAQKAQLEYLQRQDQTYAVHARDYEATSGTVQAGAPTPTVGHCDSRGYRHRHRSAFGLPDLPWVSCRLTFHWCGRPKAPHNSV